MNTNKNKTTGFHIKFKESDDKIREAIDILKGMGYNMSDVFRNLIIDKVDELYDGKFKKGVK